MSCCCLTSDVENQGCACILCHYQCGTCPVKCCDYDNDGMCWGCVCCQVQIDPCWGPRGCLDIICLCVPFGCVAKESIELACCCNPGQRTVETVSQTEQK